MFAKVADAYINFVIRQAINRTSVSKNMIVEAGTTWNRKVPGTKPLDIYCYYSTTSSTKNSKGVV
jgi:hypothetical protein